MYLAWLDHATCRTLTGSNGETVTVHPNDFHPEGPEKAAAEERAKKACAVCPVIEACRNASIAQGSEGIAAGMNLDERRAYISRGRYRSPDHDACVCGGRKKKQSILCQDCRVAQRQKVAVS